MSARGGIVSLCLLMMLAMPRTSRSGDSPEVEAEIARLRAAALLERLDHEKRVLRVGVPIGMQAVELCDDRERPYFGIVAETKDELPKFFQKAAEREFGVSRAVRVLWIEPGSPADRAGIRPGDDVLAIGGRAVRAAAALHAPGLRIGAGPIPATLRRGETTLAVELDRQPACLAATSVIQTDVANAWMAPNGTLIVTSSMLRWLARDDDLAVVLGHEIAHFVLRHSGGKQAEEEADYLGLYLVARAGFDIENAGDVWKRMARVAPYAALEDRARYSHPSSPKRALLLDRAIEEILDKVARNEPLIPQETQ